MIKEIFTDIELICVSQEAEMNTEQSRSGIITMTEEGDFRFEEAVTRSRKALNPKLFDGTYLSLVRRKDGRYQLHLKAICLNPASNAKSISKGIAQELKKAMEVVKK